MALYVWRLARSRISQTVPIAMYVRFLNFFIKVRGEEAVVIVDRSADSFIRRG